MSLINIFKGKKTYTGSTIKLYKVVTPETCQVPVVDLTKFCLEFVTECTNNRLNQMYKNYNSKPLSVNKFYEFANDENNVVVSLQAYSSKRNENGKGEQSLVFYGNNILNKTEKYKKSIAYKTETDVIDVTIFLNNFFIEKGTIIDFVSAICRIIDFDYGYVFYLEKRQCVITEGKSGLFSKIERTPFDYNRILTDTKNGYIPKIYPYNILNLNQIKSLNIENPISINRNLYLKVENDE